MHRDIHCELLLGVSPEYKIKQAWFGSSPYSDPISVIQSVNKRFPIYCTIIVTCQIADYHYNDLHGRCSPYLRLRRDDNVVDRIHSISN